MKSFAVLDYVVVQEKLFLVQDGGAPGLFAGLTLKDKFSTGEYRVSLSRNRSKVILENRAGVLDSAAVGDSLGLKVGLAWVPNAKALKPEQPMTFTIRMPREVARELGRSVIPKMAKDGSFVTLTLKGPDRAKLASTMNTLTDRFVNLAAELKAMRLKEFATILSDQLSTAERNLTDAESALETVKVEYITMPTDAPFTSVPGTVQTVAPAQAQFMSLKTQEEQLQNDRKAIERVLAQSVRDSALAIGELQAIQSVQSSGELQVALQDVATRRSAIRALQYKYTDEHPDVKKQQAELAVLERQTVPSIARGVMAELSRREAQTTGLIGSATTELRQIPPRLMEETRMKRQFAIAENVYSMLRSRKEEADLAALSSRPDLRIVDAAKIPIRPVADTRIMMILMSLAVSLGVVAGGIFLFDKLDRRVRFPEEVTHGLRLPVLAAIPRSSAATATVGDQDQMSQVIEAFRGLRLRLLHARNGSPALVTAITSPGSGDGKSFVAVNLALAFADQGYRTLLIDGDVRRGGLHRFLGVNRQPGLTNLLAGNATTEEVVQRTNYRQLDLIGCGTRLQVGPELLGSPALTRLINEMREQYAVILVDTPPLGAGVDPFVLGTATGNLLVVLRAGYTDREFAEAKLGVLDQLPVRILGGILNGVPSGTGAYRYYSYISGYEAVDEERALTEGIRVPVTS